MRATKNGANIEGYLPVRVGGLLREEAFDPSQCLDSGSFVANGDECFDSLDLAS